MYRQIFIFGFHEFHCVIQLHFHFFFKFRTDAPKDVVHSLIFGEKTSLDNELFESSIFICVFVNMCVAMDRAIAEGHVGYCQAAGIPELRHALAEDVHNYIL